MLIHDIPAIHKRKVCKAHTTYHILWVNWRKPFIGGGRYAS